MNIRASEAIIFQREYWELQGLNNLNQIYGEIKDDTWHVVNLWKSVNAAGMGVPHIITLLKVANNDLPTLEYGYVKLKQEVNSLQKKRKNAVSLILAPYLINIKKVSYEDALNIINSWLMKCGKLRQLDQNFRLYSKVRFEVLGKEWE